MSGPLDDAWKVFYDALVHKGQTFRHALADYEAATTAAEADVEAAAATFAALLAGQPPVPPPTGGIIPADANQVKIGASTFPLAAVNPTPATHPGGFLQPTWNGRGPDELVAFQAPVTASGTNPFGRECTVVAGRATGPTVVNAGPIAPEAYALSGHGAAAAWLDANVRPGVVVEVLKADAPPVIVPPASAGKTLAGYLQDGQDVDTIPGYYTQVRVAFVRMVNGVLTAVEWGGKTAAQTQAQLSAWASAPGRQVLLATGGEGGGNNLGDVAAFVSGYRALAPKYGARGADYDEEGTLNGANSFAISKTLAASDPSFIASFVPPGGDPVPPALAAAKACHDAGVRVQFGFQGYGAVDSDDDIIGRTRDAVAALGAPQVLVGFMVGADPKTRTPAQCESLMRKVIALWPDIGGAYFWRIGAPGNEDAAQRVAAVLGLPAKL